MTNRLWTVELQNARSIAEQIIILQSLKTNIIGHPIKKESIVVQGALHPISQIVLNQSHTKQETNLSNNSPVVVILDECETCRLQGLQIIASIAFEGPRFLSFLQSANVFPAILSNICPIKNTPQLVLASLRALSNLVDSIVLSSDPKALNTSTVAEGLFSRQHLASLCQILSQTSSSALIATQISITASLISRICCEDRHQQNLANSGILNALATKFASYIISAELIPSEIGYISPQGNVKEKIQETKSLKIDLAGILEAIYVIISHSKLRSSQFIYSPSILALFPIPQLSDPFEMSKESLPCNTSSTSGLKTRPGPASRIDCLLPLMPYHQPKSSSPSTSAYPHFSGIRCYDDLSQNGRTTANKSKSSSLHTWGDKEINPATHTAISSRFEEYESPIIPFLIMMIRMRSHLERLMSSAILAVLHRVGLTHTKREIDIGLTIVPVLAQMMGESPIVNTEKESLESVELTKVDRVIKETSPSVLAMFITDSEHLQKSAFDAGVIAKFSSLLRSSYEPVSKSNIFLTWYPHASEDNEDDEFKANRLRSEIQCPLLAHKIKVRESTLRAIAALVPFKDEYRKSVVDQGLMPYIVESMSPSAGNPSQSFNGKVDKIEKETNDKTIDDCYGKNPVKVLIAACGTVRALSRSVSVLRTTLIDNGVAEPVFRLLQHPDIEVQIAATATVINLLTDVSPMRETIRKAGVLQILCKHAKSIDPRLRLNAVWALKHFVQGVNNDMKRQCFEELGQAWLVHLICDDIEDMALHSSKSKSEKTSTSIDSMDEDTDMGQFEEQIDTAFGTSDCQSSIESPSLDHSRLSQLAERRIMALRDTELDPSRRARRDDVAVQEQGLDFIRNMIGGVGHTGTETTEMIDFLFDALGQDRMFEILSSKLRPRAVNPYSRKASGLRESKVIPPQPEIIIAVGYILVHMAASIPRHRQLVISQSELLKLLVPQFNHSTIEVRLVLCCLVTNLTWVDDEADEHFCAQRASELIKLGFLNKLEMLENDVELSVRERAKTAIWQMKQSC
ncbi:BgTH12-01164 [Blumeria graminis f. sp. triticale]|uniref:BgTH12-01164 n=1 Tax=Blumeria graminis f. sp. triticale TaxID=1689686 RepID=A0A9W4GHH5_BLUGR|nr:BgTH12-01164 [Blumeria graminis f. sp. triticale]